MRFTMQRMRCSMQGSSGDQMSQNHQQAETPETNFFSFAILPLAGYLLSISTYLSGAILVRLLLAVPTTVLATISL